MDLTHARRASALHASAASPSGVAPADAIAPAALLGHRGELPIAETSLSFGLRLRLTLLGVGLGLCGFAICVALGLLIAAGPFHTSLGSIA